MKSSLIVFFTTIFTIISFSCADNEQIMKLQKKFEENYAACMTKTGATEAQLKEFHLMETPKTKEVQCFFACLGKSFGFMKSDNTFDETQIQKTIDIIREGHKTDDDKKKTALLDDILKTCVPLQTGVPDECVAAKKAMDCFIENGKKNGFLEK